MLNTKPQRKEEPEVSTKRKKDKDGYYVEPYTASIEDVRPSVRPSTRSNASSRAANRTYRVRPTATENVLLVHKNGAQVYVRHMPFEDCAKVSGDASHYEVTTDRDERKLLSLSLTNPAAHYRAAAAEQAALLAQLQGAHANRTATPEVDAELLHQLQLLDAPAVLDTYRPPAPRAAALRAYKHASKLHYLEHKMLYSDEALRLLEMQDRRALLSHERRQVFLRQLQQDFAFRAKHPHFDRALEDLWHGRYGPQVVRNVTHVRAEGLLLTQVRQVQEQHLQLFFLTRDQQQRAQRRASLAEGKRRRSSSHPADAHFFTLDSELLPFVTGATRPADGYILLFTERWMEPAPAAPAITQHAAAAAAARQRNVLFFENEREEEAMLRSAVVIPIVYASAAYAQNPQNEKYKKSDYFSVKEYYKQVHALQVTRQAKATSTVNKNTKNNIREQPPATSSLFEPALSQRNISDVSNNTSSDVPINNCHATTTTITAKPQQANSKTVASQKVKSSSIISPNVTPLRKPNIAF